MKIINAYTQILSPNFDNPKEVEKVYKQIETAGRTCYKSESKITEESARKFVSALIKSGHEAMIEHASMTVRFVVDRGVSHELVRHRLASFAQESTRYCNYSQDKFGNEIAVIDPYFFRGEGDFKKLDEWMNAMIDAERHYLKLLELGATPQEARTVLPNSLKTEVIMTANMREWRHFFKLRAAGVTGKPHPQMVEVALPLLRQCQQIMPELFGDIEVVE